MADDAARRETAARRAASRRRRGSARSAARRRATPRGRERRADRAPSCRSVDRRRRADDDRRRDREPDHRERRGSRHHQPPSRRLAMTTQPHHREQCHLSRRSEHACARAERGDDRLRHTHRSRTPLWRASARSSASSCSRPATNGHANVASPAGVRLDRARRHERIRARSARASFTRSLSTPDDRRRRSRPGAQQGRGARASRRTPHRASTATRATAMPPATSCVATSIPSSAVSTTSTGAFCRRELLARPTSITLRRDLIEPRERDAAARRAARRRRPHRTARTSAASPARGRADRTGVEHRAPAGIDVQRCGAETARPTESARAAACRA